VCKFHILSGIKSKFVDRLLAKNSDMEEPFIVAVSVYQLEPRTVSTLPSQQENPILGRTLLGSPLDLLPAA